MFSDFHPVVRLAIALLGIAASMASMIIPEGGILLGFLGGFLIGGLI